MPAGGIQETEAAAALIGAREEVHRRAKRARYGGRPLLRLMLYFLDHAIGGTPTPSEAGELLASLRRIYGAAVLIERRTAR